MLHKNNELISYSFALFPQSVLEAGRAGGTGRLTQTLKKTRKSAAFLCQLSAIHADLSITHTAEGAEQCTLTCVET